MHGIIHNTDWLVHISISNFKFSDSNNQIEIRIYCKDVDDE